MATVTSHDRGRSLGLDLLRSMNVLVLCFASLLMLEYSSHLLIFTNSANLFLSVVEQPLPILIRFLHLLANAHGVFSVHIVVSHK